MAERVNIANHEDVLSYHAPTEYHVECISKVREAAMNLVRVILEVVPECADQQAAIRKIREGMMTANAGVVLKGKI